MALDTSDIDYLKISFNTVNSSDTIVAGDMMHDIWQVEGDMFLRRPITSFDKTDDNFLKIISTWTIEDKT